MTAGDMAILVQALAPAVKQVVTAALGPVQERIAAIEARQAAVKDLDVDQLARLAAALVPAPKDGLPGKDADEGAMTALVGDVAALRFELGVLKALPPPVLPDVATLVTEAVTKAVADLEPTLPPIIADHVREAVAALPPASKGDPGTPGQDGAPGRDGVGVVAAVIKDGALALRLSDGQTLEAGPVVGPAGPPGLTVVGEKGEPGAPGRDGVGVAGALLSKDGALVVTLSDGTVKELGRVVGDNGAPGQPGRDGQDGRDGLGAQDLEIVQTGERSFAFQWTKGDVRREEVFRFATPLYKDIWDREKAYEPGDVVTYGGSMWIAKGDVAAGVQPGTNEGAAAWRLSVKKGTDGRRGEPGQKGDPGPRGKDGA